MSLYDYQAWNDGVNYVKNDVVYIGASTSPEFYYALSNHTSTNENAPDSDFWDGMTWYQGENYPHFFWVPSYDLTVRQQPRVKVVKFGDGYEQRTPDGITTNLLEIDYTFANRNNNEAKAILHFLDRRAASEAFVHTPIAPYDTPRKFVCRTWEHTLVFVDNFNIRVKFEEVS